jgi:hypothetical protein
MKMPRKLMAVLVVLGILGLVALWQWVGYLFRAGYSKGSRTGIVRKVSVKGPPYCKYLEGEMALQGGVPGVAQDIFIFTVDDHSDSNPLVQDLQKAEREGTPVTLDYRQDKHIWWRCNGGGMAGIKSEYPDSQYYIVKVTPRKP